MKNRILWIDIVKIFAIFSVLLMHAASPILYKIGNIDISIWNIGNIYDSIGY